MRCRTCDYPLWNLATRSCPECGAGFSPRDYSFEPGSVQFCCPHCDQKYYGTSAQGHLEPDAFACVGCGRDITLDEMIVRGEEGAGSAMASTTLPWLEREERGLFKAWFATIGKAMMAPAETMNSIPTSYPFGAAYAFMAASCLIFWVVGTLLPQAVSMVIMSVVLSQAAAQGGAAIPVGFILLQNGLQSGLGLVAILLGPILWAGCLHLLLLVSGGAAGGWRRTWQAVCFSSAASAPSAVPCCGGTVGAVWWLVSCTVMVREAHGTGGVRATFASVTSALVFILVFLTLTFGSSFLFVGGFAGGMAAGVAAAGTSAEASAVSAGMARHRQQNGGALPSHGLALLDAGVSASDFVAADTMTNLTDVPVGSGTLLDIYMVDDPSAVVEDMARALPEDVVGHRVGDFVFVYHGIEPGDHPRLWTAVLLPDPDVNQVVVSGGMPATGSAGRLEVVRLDGSIRSYPRSEMTRRIRRQNERRRDAGLPLLPADLDVRHGAPLTASAIEAAGPDEATPVPDPPGEQEAAAHAPAAPADSSDPTPPDGD